MVTKIVKFLKNLSEKERVVVGELLIVIESKEWKGLDIKKLHGQSNIFRIRKGSIRIIFSVKDTSVEIIDIERRSEKTYRGY
jgi:mRNA-degrading endonuclease RelE of RelBE toxin-antitoxin system